MRRQTPIQLMHALLFITLIIILCDLQRRITRYPLCMRQLTIRDHWQSECINCGTDQTSRREHITVIPIDTHHHGCGEMPLPWLHIQHPRGDVRWPGRAAHFCLPPFPTWAISNYSHFQLQPFPTCLAISNLFGHFRMPTCRDLWPLKQAA